MKIMKILIVCFDSKGIIHKEFVRHCINVNASFYQQLLDCLCKRIAPITSELWRHRSYFFLDHDAQVHTAGIKLSFCLQNGSQKSTVPSDFPDIKDGLQGEPFCVDRRYERSRDKIVMKYSKDLKDLPTLE